MASAEGVDMLADKASTNNADISEAYMCQMLMMFVIDELKEIDGMTPDTMYDRIASATLMWTRTMGNDEYRKPLRPIYEKWLND